MRQELELSPFYRERNRGMERLNKLSRELGMLRAGVPPPGRLTRGPVLPSAELHLARK